MRIAPALAVTLLLSSAAGTAWADQDLIRRAGEWEVTRPPNPGESGPAQSRKTCYASDQTLTDAATKGMQDCSKKNVQMSGGVLHIEAICKIDGAEVAVNGTITPTGDDSFHTESHMHFNQPPKGAPSDITLTTDAKRLGTCQPGETPK